MGMTYKIIALPKGVTPKQYINSEDIEDEELVDDLVFDRECLAKWCGTTRADWFPPNDNYAIVLTKAHIDRAIDTLQGLLDKVASMPFTKDDDADYEETWNSQTETWEKKYYGSKENIAILKEVNKVFSRHYHFTYPWEREDWKDDCRATGMIHALQRVRRFMEHHPDRAVIALYY